MSVVKQRLNLLSDVSKQYLFSKYSTIKKRINLIKAIWNWKIRKPLILNNYPIQIILGTGPICNLNCFLCPSGQKAKGRKIGFLQKEVVLKVIDELGPYLFSVGLYNWGEPLLNKNIFDYIALLKKANILVSISSNLTIFNDSICKKLIQSGLDILIVSLHGCSDDSLNKYQKGGHFSQVISNVKKIQEYKKLKSKSHPKIIWRFKVTKFNEREIPQAQNLYKKIGFDKFEPSSISCDMGKELLWNNEEQFLNVEPFLPKNEYWSKYNYSERRKKFIRKNDCYWLWNFTTINWNGSVSPCCGVWYEKFDFGNILDTPFLKIWNGKKYQLARYIIKHDIPMNYNSQLICELCKKNNAILY